MAIDHACKRFSNTIYVYVQIRIPIDNIIENCRVSVHLRKVIQIPIIIHLNLNDFDPIQNIVKFEKSFIHFKF